MTQEIDIAELRKKAQELKLVPTRPTADMLFAMAECAGFPPGGLTRFEDYWQMAMSVVPQQPAIDLNALLDRLEQAEKDAARYRWIAKQRHAWAVIGDAYDLPSEFEGANSLSEAIDAAMQGEGA